MSKLQRNMGRRKVIPDAVIEAVVNARGKQVDIAVRFGLSQATVSKIRTGKIRK